MALVWKSLDKFSSGRQHHHHLLMPLPMLPVLMQLTVLFRLSVLDNGIDPYLYSKLPIGMVQAIVNKSYKLVMLQVLLEFYRP